MNGIIKKTAEYVKNLQESQLPLGCVYHNVTHTEEVVEAAKEIGENSGLTGDELEMVLIAAWLHDSGLVKDYLGHEEASAAIAKEFLKEHHYPHEKITIIENLILATRVPQKPLTLLEQVLCDADIAHIGKKGYNTKAELLRAEWEQIKSKKFTDFEWYKMNIEFITTNPFHTDYAKQNFEERRIINLSKVQKRLREEVQEDKPPKVVTDEEKDAKALEKEKKENLKAIERGVATMFRNTIRTHVEFSGLADNKANIMISVNTLLLTAIIAVLARKLDSNPHLVIPTALITLVSLTTLIFAVLVTRPKITSGVFTQEDITNKKANLLFFGNFYMMNLKDFHWGMTEMMKDREFLYSSMIKDFYYLGQVLGQKYKYLRICYNIFMYGLIISIIAFTLAVMFYPGQTVIGPILE